jgi:transcriptional regulator MraZ
MFRGTTSHSIDPKGRIIVPARFRELVQQDGGGLIVTRMDGALRAYTYPNWEKVEQKILDLPTTSDSMRRFRLFFIGSATDCRVDKQGRFLIPPDLRLRVNLTKEIMLVGQLNHFQIWDRERYEADNEQFELEVLNEEVRNEIAELGL